MANEREETKQPRNEDKEAIKDLDIDESQADAIKGGRVRTADPCAGGE